MLCFVFMSAYCMFDLSVYYMFLQYFDTVGWVFWPVKTVSHILCWRGRKTVLNPIQSTKWQSGRLTDSQWRLMSVLVQCCCIQHGVQRAQYNKWPRGTSFENIQLSRWWRQRRRSSWSFIEQARLNNVLLSLWIFDRCWLFLRFKINMDDLGHVHDDSTTCNI